jgi:lipopolysaccharide/colanic/teichoic acid biosynthesis glycosyltransferase
VIHLSDWTKTLNRVRQTMKAGLDNWIDIVVLVIYFVLVLVVGLLVSIAKYSTMYNS